MAVNIQSRLIAAVGLLILTVAPASAQMKEVDPNEAWSNTATPSYDTPAATTGTNDNNAADSGDFGNFPNEAQPATSSVSPPPAAGSNTVATTYQKDDLIGAAEGVFGKGAKGLAGVIEDILRKQGEPNGYIVGREGGGAFVFGLRYGSGTLYHKVEGERKAYWTGPSLGFDAGANAGNTFILVYNLYDTQDLYKRYAQGEGAAYLIGGFHVSYLRRGDVVLIPVRLGVGLRLGANVGYMKFSEKQRWLPF